MKKSASLIMLFIVASSFIMFSCDGKKAETKKKAISSFEKMYPQIKDVKWNWINDSIWEAHFIFNEKEMTAKYNNSGVWLKSRTNINAEEIPMPVMDRIDGFYYGYVITGSRFVETPDFKGYEIDIDVNGKGIELLISESGGLRKAQPAGQNTYE